MAVHPDGAGSHRWEGAVGHLSPADRQAEADEFDQGMAAVTAYARRHGDTAVPGGHVDDAGFRLGVWVADQRLAHLESRLADARREALERVAAWSWTPTSTGRDELGRFGT
ncbi:MULTISPECIES: helicase associated domain-containing protein [unclassified Pseudofrankia]|uniref:helicase associated domain-containing protein n=1 Tax=unclassified Pseudofrankia TaxID=2994372 RepID=UPI000E2A3790|nr:MULTISPECIES: helicase associated domain-containing protein [unclassified Pseudofrankia]MDT3442530.1 helicase associated domain-containing protein [Pseudofrankia sp. BMG5.37]